MKKVFFILATIFVFVFVICALNYQWIYYRFYPLDRITGEYEISVNGKDIDAMHAYYRYDDNGKIKLENDTENYKIKGGKYGRYEIGFVLDHGVLFQLTNDERFQYSRDLDLSVVYYNLNWWHISELDIEIDIVQNNGEWYVCYDVDLEEPTEDFKISTSSISKKIKLDEMDSTEINIGM